MAFCLAIVLPKGNDQPVATLIALTTTKSGWLSNVTENVFNAIKKDHSTLVWTVSQEDEHLTWFFEKSEGTLREKGRVLFSYGCDLRSEALNGVYEDFVSGGRAMLSE